MRRLRSIVSLVLLASSAQISQAEDGGRYTLGPQDRLMIRVYDLRRNSGEAYSWAALNGEFAVGADGFVLMPIIGRVRATDGTVSDLATAIGQALKKTADLAETPAASVEVNKYRPFYIMGAVQQPGKYEYQPSLSVLQAVSTAQGLVRDSDARAVRREFVAAGGEVRTLEAERMSLSVKKARLEAEIAGSESIAFGDDVRSRATDPRIAPAMRAETLLFETRRSSLRAEVAAIEQSKISYRQELSSLDVKLKSLDRQLELSRRELDLVNDLVSKGLTISPRKLAAEQSQAAYEGSRLDVQVAGLRAQQSLARAERDVIELQSRFRKEALNESVEVRTKLDQNEEKMRTAERLRTDAESRMLGSDGGSDNLIPSYEITRTTPSGTKSWLSAEDDPVRPGDVVRVTLTRKPYGDLAARDAVRAPPGGSAGQTDRAGARQP